MNQIRQISEFSIYTALAFIFGYIESLIPLPVPFPGMKIGLANLVMMIVLYRKNFRYAFGISMLRNLLNAITFGSLFSLLYSLAGSVLSLIAMAGLKKVRRARPKSEQKEADAFSIVSVSALGGIVHKMGPLRVAAFLVGFSSIIWYLPVLYFCGLLTGILIGMVSNQCLARLPADPQNR